LHHHQPLLDTMPTLVPIALHARGILKHQGNSSGLSTPASSPIDIVLRPQFPSTHHVKVRRPNPLFSGLTPRTDPAARRYRPPSSLKASKTKLNKAKERPIAASTGVLSERLDFNNYPKRSSEVKLLQVKAVRMGGTGPTERLPRSGS
jgi:hypothetical protein